MKNIFLIARREYLTQVKKKSFFIITLLTPLMMIAFGGFIGYIFQANKAEYNINVVDNTGMFYGKLRSNNEINYFFVESSLSEKKLKNNLTKNPKTDGVLIIPKLNNNHFEQLEQNSKLFVNKNIGYKTEQSIARDLTEIIRKEKIKTLGISETTINDLDKKFSLNVENIIDQNNTDTGLSFGIKSGIGMVLMYAVFMFIIIYGVRIMRSVLEEKNNRVVEIIISSIKPFELMMGKILGVTGVALTQFSIWIIMALGSALLLNHNLEYLTETISSQSSEFTSPVQLSNNIEEITQTLLEINFPLIIFVFITFFLLGYIFYSSIYAAIGSAVDNETETQQFTFIAIVPLMIAVYGSFSIINNPDGPMAFWMSIIPFTAPVMMTARIPFGVPLWEIILSITILLLSTLLIVYIASKIYRVGILMRGNKATIKELWKWIRY